MNSTNNYTPQTKMVDPKTSSSNGESSDDKNSGESVVQEGEQVVNEEDQNKALNQEETNEEFISDININTTTANLSPEGLVGLATIGNDGDDDPLKEIEIGDDPEETKKKIPVM